MVLKTNNMKQYKLVTIITKEMRDEKGAILQKEGLAVRVPKRLAQLQVERGYAHYTSKGKFKSMLVAQRKKQRREEILAAKKRTELAAKERAEQNKSKHKAIGHRRKPL